MVTHEDIAEEVVGEIQARDQSSGEELITALSRDRFLLSGGMDIEYFMRRFNVPIDKKGFETLSGFVEYRMGKIPKKGDRFDYDQYTFIIDEATDRSIEKVIVQLHKEKEAAQRTSIGPMSSLPPRTWTCRCQMTWPPAVPLLMITR